MSASSLSTRLLVAVSLVLLMFFGATIWVLDTVYRKLAESFISTRLELQVSNLISASDEQDQGKLIPGETLRESRFQHLGSGLYAQIQRSDGEVMWWSPSLTGTKLELYVDVEPGKRLIRQMQLPDGSEVQALSVGLEWEFPKRQVHRFTYTVAEDLAPYRAELRSVREQLLIWFGGLTVALLFALAFLFRWVLNPIRRVEREIQAIEAGDAQELSSRYPRELAGITRNMNALLRGERERLKRYRDTLGNLAHSLKTPLAVARSVAQSPEVQQQIQRMDEIVSYQLKRASMSGGTGLGTAPVEVREVLVALRDTLLKVYADKQLTIDVECGAEVRYAGDRGDLMEIAGNIMDNACKWTQKRVQVSSKPMPSPNSRREGLLLVVEDDGPGIAIEQREHVLKRGARLDERVSGQGIGLSVVQDLAQLSGGGVDIDVSALGGCKVTVRLPAP